MKIKAMLLILAMLLVPALGLVGPASADPTPACDTLLVWLGGDSDGWFVDAKKCKHGKASRVDDVNILLLPVDSGLYGPDCEIVIEKKDAKIIEENRYVYRVGQGICNIKLKAGNIHVEQKGEMSLQYTKKKGSYRGDSGGEVSFIIPK